ncbi:MAG: hypothetical protein QOK05_1489 [Chloroflexota bacterium]|nr:hypothetical protein [Chloroflexota bacterium]
MTWARFKEERGPQLDAWLKAERQLAQTRLQGLEDFDAGDRLVAAEAALQTAIIDFSASQPGISNPTPLALEILRLAEATLDSARSRRVARARVLRGPGNPPGPAAEPPARRPRQKHA